MIVGLILCMLIFHDFFRLQIFFKVNFFKNSFRNIIRVSNSLDPDYQQTTKFAASKEKESLKLQKRVVFLLDLILYVPSTIFQLCLDRSSWVEHVLS